MGRFPGVWGFAPRYYIFYTSTRPTFYTAKSTRSQPCRLYVAEPSRSGNEGHFPTFGVRFKIVRPVSWSAVRRFIQLSKIEAPKGLGRAPDSVTLSARSNMSPHLQRAKTSFTPISRLDCGGDSSIPPNVYRPQKNFSLFSMRGKTRTLEAPSCASRGA